MADFYTTAVSDARAAYDTASDTARDAFHHWQANPEDPAAKAAAEQATGARFDAAKALAQALADKLNLTIGCPVTVSPKGVAGYCLGWTLASPDRLAIRWVRALANGQRAANPARTPAEEWVRGWTEANRPARVDASDLHAMLVEADAGEASSNDVAQWVDWWFVDRGYRSILFGN